MLHPFIFSLSLIFIPDLEPGGYQGPCLAEACSAEVGQEPLMCLHTAPNYNPSIDGTWCSPSCEDDDDCPGIDGYKVHCTWGVCVMQCSDASDCAEGAYCVPAPLSEHWCVWW